MSNIFETKIIKQKKLGQECLLKISKNEANNLIFVEFSSINGKFIVQKSFQDTIEGRERAKEFQNKIKNIKDLRNYLGIK
jgi:hypothetical protein